MSKFTLRQRTSTKFQVLCGDDIVGSICVTPEQVPELLRHFPGSSKPTSQMAAVPFMRVKPPAGILHQGAKHRPVNRKAILRGC